jgi:hypothetical protein
LVPTDPRCRRPGRLDRPGRPAAESGHLAQGGSPP